MTWLEQTWETVSGIGLIVAIIATALFGLVKFEFLDTFFPTRYKIVVTVNVDGTLYQGSAVHQYYCRTAQKWLQVIDNSTCYFTKAEAVVVDLKQRGYLFLLISGRHLTDHAGCILPILSARGQNPFEKDTRDPLPEKWQLLNEQIPFMVTFGNIQDSKSIKEVNPKNLAASFGPGVHLHSIEAEETREPITQDKLYKVLPWLINMKDELKIITTDGPGRLSRVDFSWGVTQ